MLGLDGRITHASWMAEELAGQPPVGRTFSEAFSLETQSAAQAGTLARFSAEILDALLVTRPFHGVEVKLRGSKLANRSFLLSAGPLLNDAKESIGSLLTMTEITERKRAEEQQTMLVAELNHRVKNILAIVQSVAAQTVRSTPSLESFSAAFSGRIKALSIAHDILTQTRWIGIGLNELLAEVLAPYRLAGEDRLSIEGPPVLLPAGAVMPLSMAVHELATNASKYGALSGPQGKVVIRWQLQSEGRPNVELNWTEEGGPIVERPPATGFGTTLIERTIAYDLDGKSELAFPPEGLRCLINFSSARGGGGGGDNSCGRLNARGSSPNASEHPPANLLQRSVGEWLGDARQLPERLREQAVVVIARGDDQPQPHFDKLRQNLEYLTSAQVDVEECAVRSVPLHMSQDIVDARNRADHFAAEALQRHFKLERNQPFVFGDQNALAAQIAVVGSVMNVIAE